ncbi:calcium-dependent secretion activator 2-like protein [Lates japonicus]|uniref:Calcium-dependent secretion activator 2-like protein n=1 Tax=Lates japonicus TaxID=270547 RepID=A0AAD3MN56_LATJO|nr:calcium-dependent secretion activator 2-like protein [Lates japonicus]
MDLLIHFTRIYSEDIGMPLGLDKCRYMVAKTDRVIRTEGVELPEGKITDIQASYKYLGATMRMQGDQP